MSGQPWTIRSGQLIVAGLFALSGCVPVTTRWQEEVALSDGRVIVVSRQILYEKEGGEWGRDSALRPSGERLKFTDPLSGVEVRWAAPHRIASVLDVIDGTVWIVARQQVCRPEDRGEPFWQAFALRADGWRPVMPDEAPAFTRPNLALDSANHKKTSQWRFISISQKRVLDDASRVDSRMRQIRWRSDLDC